MFSKILIANRGEIACRVISTCNAMGIATVAVYSEADAGARHVRMADEAVAIGEAAVSASYLRGERIIEAALRTGAEAIHPGYGFLSENPDFVEAVEAAGLVFIGPPASAIRAMGLKDAAKALMTRAGIPVVPGYHGGNQDPVFLAAEAERIGYPVLIKARAGGGGKGMRLVERAGDFPAALESARREALSSFGDADCLIEKYIQRPRHIEMQVFADGHGNVVHLFERDCSLQRRHQKVIEEAPAPGMTEAVRTAMGRAATEAARAIGYRGAGTIEFIADGSHGLREDGFWFMEMNTRLQVEHPVSEAITGLDFVALQLRIAAGEALPFAQHDLKINGWSVEARLYAEDAARNFQPAIGQLERLGFPEATAFSRGPLRVDSGVVEGDAITPHYDPMIAKIIAHGPNRDAAFSQLSKALGECRVAGTTTNVQFLGRLVDHPQVRAGEVDTGLIAREFETLTLSDRAEASDRQLAAIIDLGLVPTGEDDPWDALTGFTAWTGLRSFSYLTLDGEALVQAVRTVRSGVFHVGDDAGEMNLARTSNGFSVVNDGRRSSFDFVCSERAIVLFHEGRRLQFERSDALAADAGQNVASDVVVAPMPGVVTAVSATAGALVEAGAPLVTVEAMKMEQTFTAPRRGRIAEITVSAGEQISEGTVLVRFEAEDGK